MNRTFVALVVSAVLFPLGGAGSAYAIDLSKVTFNGYIDIEYAQSSNKAGDPNGAFHQHHLSFLMDAPVNDRVSGHFHIEFDHGVNTAAANGGDIIVEKSFIQYFYDDHFQFRFGKVLTPFGYYNEVHDATPVFLSVGIPRTIYRQNERGGTAMFPKWTTGINVLGVMESGSTIVDYIFYVGNGENIPTVNEAEHDSNRNKAFGGRVAIQRGELTSVAVSFYSGEKAESGSRLTTSHTTWGLMFATGVGDLAALAEYASSDVGGMVDVGAYGQLSYPVNRQLTAYYRYERTEPDNGTARDAWNEQIIGINIMPVENLIFKAEVADHVRDANNRGIGTDPSSLAPNPKDYMDIRFAVTLFF